MAPPEEEEASTFSKRALDTSIVSGFSITSINSRDELYSRPTIDKLFISLLQDDDKSKVSQHLSALITEINLAASIPSGGKSAEETKCLRQDVDLHTRRIQEKIDIIKNRYNQYYLQYHPRRREEIERAKTAASIDLTEMSPLPALKNLPSTSA